MDTSIWHHNTQGELFLEAGKRLWSQGQYGANAQVEFGKAIREFTAAIKILEPTPQEEKNPDAAWSYAHLAEVQMLVGNSANAEENFNRAIERSEMAGKKNPYAYAHLGEYYRAGFRTKENFKKARQYFTKAIEQRSDSAKESCYVWAYAHRGASYDFASANEDEIKAALKDLDVAIAQSGGTYAWAIAFRSVVYMYLSRKEQDIEKVKRYTQYAWKDLLKAITLAPYIISVSSTANF